MKKVSNFSVDKDGVMRANAGIFSGYQQTPFKWITNSDAVNVGGTYPTFRVQNDLYLAVNSANSTFVYVVLPVNSTYNGKTVVIYDSTFGPYTRVPVGTRVRVSDGSSFGGCLGNTIGTPTKSQGPTEITIIGGIVRFTGVPISINNPSVRWVVETFVPVEYA